MKDQDYLGFFLVFFHENDSHNPVEINGKDEYLFDETAEVALKAFYSHERTCIFNLSSQIPPSFTPNYPPSLHLSTTSPLVPISSISFSILTYYCS